MSDVNNIFQQHFKEVEENRKFKKDFTLKVIGILFQFAAVTISLTALYFSVNSPVKNPEQNLQLDTIQKEIELMKLEISELKKTKSISKVEQ